jgi:hypothetical protein
VVVELKLALNLKVLLQCVARLSITPKVYAGVSSACPMLGRDRKHLTKLFRMLGLGLISIHPKGGKSSVQVLLDPGVYRPRASKQKREHLLGEFQKRVGDPNLGGVAARRGIMTAYRQRALRIAAFLESYGPTKASVIAASLEEPKARDILYSDVYGWFERIGGGIYTLAPKGRDGLSSWGDGTARAGQNT